jgi:hypothetical protein
MEDAEEARASPVGGAHADSVGTTPPPAPPQGKSGVPDFPAQISNPATAGLRGEGSHEGSLHSSLLSDRPPDGEREQEEDWDEVRHLYELSDVPTADILRNFGLTASALRWRREREEWATRLPIGAKKQPIFSPARLRARLLLLHSTVTKRLEAHLAPSGEFDESEARSLALLCGALRDLSEVTMTKPSAKEREAKPSREKKSEDGGRDAYEADTLWFRAELKKRIQRIRAAAGLGG